MKMWVICASIFLSTLSLRRATNQQCKHHPNHEISIHALLAESDVIRRAVWAYYQDISIHALLAESDVEKVPADVYYQAFLSTLSLRRATLGAGKSCNVCRNFYPRSPCGERRKPKRLKSRRCVFLSTLSLRRATVKLVSNSNITTNFYPRSPCGERPWHLHCVFIFAGISIHALLAESDRVDLFFLWCIIISIHALLAESDPSPNTA